MLRPLLLHRLTEKLTAVGVLQGKLRGILRVRFPLLDRMKDLQTVIRLPEHLVPCFGRDEIPACELGNNYASLAKQAAARLESFKDTRTRDRWCAESFPAVTGQIEQLDRRRRELAQRDPKSHQIRELSARQKQLQVRLLDELLRQIARDTQVAEIEYWDSRGALLPWCVALGGKDLYNQIVANAETYEDSA